MIRITAVVFVLGSLLGCSSAPSNATCTSGRCDDLPDDEDFCNLRRVDVTSPNEHGFTPSALRWSCLDVAEAFDRLSSQFPDLEFGAQIGQEYCEYFIVAQLPGAKSVVLGRPLGDRPIDGITDPGLELTSAQIDELAAAPQDVVAQCVFTSWFAPDLEEAPSPESMTSDDMRSAKAALLAGFEVLGVPVTAKDFRMKYSVNTRSAAVGLFNGCSALECAEDDDLCVAPTNGDLDVFDDPMHDPFLRACELNSRANDTAWRKSDNVACTAAMRMAECGCTIEPSESIADALVPQTLAGLPLRTWSPERDLPPGCSYVENPVGAQLLVSCDVTAQEVLQHSYNLRNICTDQFASKIVVHIPVPEQAVSCTGMSISPYDSSCSAQPWIVPAVGM